MVAQFGTTCTTCNWLHDLVPFVQLVTCILTTICTTWRSVTFSMQLTKNNTPPWVFQRFLHCINGAKSHNASHIVKDRCCSF